MSRETARFFAIAFPLGVIGAVVSTLLGWGDTGVFLATMGPVSVVMLIFMLLEPRDDERLDDGVKPPAHRRA